MQRATCLICLIVSLAVAGGCRDEIAPDEDVPETDGTISSRSCDEYDGFERQMCADPEVAALDAELATMVNRLVAHSSHDRQADLRAEQRAWEQDRDSCLKLAVSKRRMCIDAKYASRMNAVRDALAAME